MHSAKNGEELFSNWSLHCQWISWSLLKIIFEHLDCTCRASVSRADFTCRNMRHRPSPAGDKLGNDCWLRFSDPPAAYWEFSRRDRCAFAACIPNECDRYRYRNRCRYIARAHCACYKSARTWIYSLWLSLLKVRVLSLLFEPLDIFSKKSSFYSHCSYYCYCCCCCCFCCCCWSS